jgi:hypothetical protein
VASCSMCLPKVASAWRFQITDCAFAGRAELVPNCFSIPAKWGSPGAGLHSTFGGNLTWRTQPSLLNRVNSMPFMSSRLDKSWTVFASHQTDEANRCVDIFRGPMEPSVSKSSAEIQRTWARGRRSATSQVMNTRQRLTRLPRRDVPSPGSVHSWIAEGRPGTLPMASGDSRNDFATLWLCSQLVPSRWDGSAHR